MMTCRITVVLYRKARISRNKRIMRMLIFATSSKSNVDTGLALDERLTRAVRIVVDNVDKNQEQKK